MVYVVRGNHIGLKNPVTWYNTGLPGNTSTLVTMHTANVSFISAWCRVSFHAKFLQTFTSNIASGFILTSKSKSVDIEMIEFKYCTFYSLRTLNTVGNSR